jgi:protein-disulfide isomerase
MKNLVCSAALALLLAGCGGQSDNGSANNSAPLVAIPAPNGGDWSQIVEQTADGFRMGNPNAPVKLVEYASPSCSHCAEFSEQGAGPLTNNYVKTGRVSWELRPYMIFPSDPGIAMLLRCRGAAPFFQLTEQIYADQPNWAGKLQSLPPEVGQQLENMSPAQRAATLVRGAGMDEFFRLRGMPEAKISECLADTSQLTALAALTARANTEGVTGTPTFFINGNKVENAANWKALEPALRSAAAS